MSLIVGVAAFILSLRTFRWAGLSTPWALGLAAASAWLIAVVVSQALGDGLLAVLSLGNSLSGVLLLFGAAALLAMMFILGYLLGRGGSSSGDSSSPF